MMYEAFQAHADALWPLRGQPSRCAALMSGRGFGLGGASAAAPAGRGLRGAAIWPR